VPNIPRSLALAVTIAGLCITASCAGTAPSLTASRMLQDELRSIERQRLRALVAADLATLDKLHSDDFEGISPFGYAFARGEYFRSIASGELDYVRWEPEDIQVRLNGAAAALRYKATADVVSRGKLLPTMRTWNTAVYERRSGRWVIVWFQVTQISPLPR
jgi:hypothetical protein